MPYLDKLNLIDAMHSTPASMSGCINKDECFGMMRMKQMMMHLVSSFPEADVVPVRNGRWIKDCDRVMGDGWTYTQRHCSECGGQSVECVNYCQFCGAKMDKDGDGERMTIVEKKPVPIYESVCPECGSVFRYKAVEVSWMHVNCPVCGISMWASTLPIGKDGDGE